MHREDFEMLKDGIIYFDNGATTLKPRVLSEAISDYYNHYSANAHRGDYDISLKVDSMYEHTRELVKDFIGANSAKEIIFTSGATASLNQIIFGYFKQILKEDEEVLITKSEHASNVLPWFEMNANVKYIPLDDDFKVTLENVEKSITDKTKVISIAETTNVIGDVRDIKKITELAGKEKKGHIEAKSKSGTSKTAKIAKKQGRTVFALPHEIGNSHGVGTNRLIKNGAILTTETEDILNALKLVEYKEKFLNLKNSNYSKIKKEFSDPMQSIIFRFINNTPISANDLSRRTGYTINEILSTLFILEMNGYIKKVSGGYITCT